MDALNLSTQPVASLALDTAPVGVLALQRDAVTLSLGSATVGILALESRPAGTINVPNFQAIMAISGLIDEYGAFLLDENGNPLLWQ